MKWMCIIVPLIIFWSKVKRILALSHTSAFPEFKSSCAAIFWPNVHRSKSKHKSARARRRGLTQYDADGNVVRARVTYGGLSDNDWSPKHRTRQRRMDYTEMPNTESEDVSIYIYCFLCSRT